VEAPADADRIRVDAQGPPTASSSTQSRRSTTQMRSAK
jgi:hypothetical protein